MGDWLAAYQMEIRFLPHLAALLFAYVLALPIAWDRERNERSAGLRTFPLVAIAACGFIQAAETVTRDNAEATARIVEGLINGVGFIGGGAILVGKASIRGTATAASLGRPVPSGLPSASVPTRRPSSSRSSPSPRSAS